MPTHSQAVCKTSWVCGKIAIMNECVSNRHAAWTSQVRHQLGSSVSCQHVHTGIILPAVLPLPPSIQFQWEAKTVGLYLSLLACVALETLQETQLSHCHFNKSKQPLRCSYRTFFIHRWLGHYFPATQLVTWFHATGSKHVSNMYPEGMPQEPPSARSTG